MIQILKSVRYYGILYLTNRCVHAVPSHNFRLWFYRSILKFKIGKASFIHIDSRFDTTGSFILGQNSTINCKCHLDNRDEIVTGDNVSISSEVYIIPADHDTKQADFRFRVRPVVIEDFACQLNSYENFTYRKCSQ